MHPIDIESTLKTMKIIVDSREHWTHPNSTDTHISDYFDRHGIEYEVRKLAVGDYAIAGSASIVVDRKQSLQELSSNLLNKADSARFWREVRRAHEQGIKLVVLIESGRTVKTINDIVRWKSKYSSVNGRRLIDEMIRLEMSYGVRWAFCDRRSTGRKIIEILKEDKKDE